MARKRKKSSVRGQPDLEAIGLVLLALGIFVLGFLIPALPTGDLGRQLREFVTSRVGLGAYAVPWPALALGAVFLLRRSPKAWPRVLVGYATTALGLWGLLMLALPASSGGWGVSLRAALAGVAGVLAYTPAVVLVTLGIEMMLALPPTRILRRSLGVLLRATRGAFLTALAARNQAKVRAGFFADVALVRKAMNVLDRDLVALSKLYPGSAELDRWRQAVRDALAKLSDPNSGRLKEAQGDLKAWQGAVRDFARDRANEMSSQFRAEAARPPLDVAGLNAETDFGIWIKGLRAQLSDPVGEPLKTARALDGVRKALALDVATLGDRYRRLGRQRDLAEAGLKKMGPRELVRASEAHLRRLVDYREIEGDAATHDVAASLLEPWRGLSGALLRVKGDFPEDPEVGEFDEAVAADFKKRGREALGQLASWSEALEAVEARSRQRAATATVPAEVPEAMLVTAAAATAIGSAQVAAERLSTLLEEAPSPPVQPGGPAGDEPFDDPFVRYAEAEVGAESDTLLEDDSASVPSADSETEAAAGQAEPAAEAVIVIPDTDSASPPAEAEGEDLPDVVTVGGIPIQIPGLDLLDEGVEQIEDPAALAREVHGRVAKIDRTLSNFKLEGRVVSSIRGPTVTRFEVEPAPGEKISRFANLSDDLALAMAVGSVRIEAPIPGKSVIGLEVPNAKRDLTKFREAAESSSFRRSRARLPLILGKSIDGEMLVADLARMPHLLIAGSTGSGKSVAVNTLVGSLLYKFLPTELRFLMIDPKMVELTPYDGIPHQVRPVVTNPNDAARVLLGAVAHMERRYKMMSKIGAKNLDQYNEKARNLDMPELPFIVVIIDELADLMITSPKEVESAIMRLAQMARATGMHLVLATQRPSVDILTSLIKVNVPARVAFAVASGHDSRTILDTMGAERLIGMGDMLFYQPGLVKPVRVQGPFISEQEIATLAAFMRRQYFDDEFVEAYSSDFDPPALHEPEADGLIDWHDDKLRVAAEMVINEGQASVSRLQRRLQVGHARAGKLMDSLESLGVVGPHMGSKPREVILTIEDLRDVFGK